MQPKKLPSRPVLNENLSPAGFWLRFFAYVLDSYIVGIIFFFIIAALVASMIAGASLEMLDLEAFKSPDNAEQLKKFLPFVALLGLLPSVMWIFYSAVFESSFLQATPGKWLLGLVVTDVEDQRVGFGKAFQRNIYKLLPFFVLLLTVAIIISIVASNASLILLAPVLFIAGFIVSFIISILVYLRVAFSEHKQGLHDLWAYSLVQKKIQFSSVQRVGFSLLAIALMIYGGAQNEVDVADSFGPASDKKISLEKSVDWDSIKNKMDTLKENTDAPAKIKLSDQGNNKVPVIEIGKEEDKQERKSEVKDNSEEDDWSFPSEDPKRAMDILKRGSEIDKGGLKNAETKVVTMPPVTVQTVSGTIRLGSKALQAKRVRSSLIDSGKVIRLDFYGASSRKVAPSPTLTILVSYKNSIGDCRRKRLTGYLVKVRAAHFGVKLPGESQWITFKRRASDVILNEKLIVHCNRERNGGWVRFSSQGGEAALIQGVRYPIEWNLKADRTL